MRPPFLEPEPDLVSGDGTNAGFGQQFVPSVGAGDFDEVAAALGDGPTANRGVAALEERIEGSPAEPAAKDVLRRFRRKHPHVMFLDIETLGDLANAEPNGAQHRHLVAQPAEEAAAVIVASVRLLL